MSKATEKVGSIADREKKNELGLMRKKASSLSGAQHTELCEKLFNEIKTSPLAESTAFLDHFWQKNCKKTVKDNKK